MNFENYLNLACVVGVILSVSSPLGNTFIQLVAAISFSFVLLLLYVNRFSQILHAFIFRSVCKFRPIYSSDLSFHVH